MNAIDVTLDQDIAGKLFDRAYFQGLRARVWAALHRRPSRLLDLNELSAGWTIHSRHFAGSRSVPIKQIRGSENRADDFDAAFHPLDADDKDRWRRVAEAWMRRHNLPPIELIHAGDIYFVRDGHHRISVAAALGEQEIDAVVTEWEVEDVRTAAQRGTGHEPGGRAAPASSASGSLGSIRDRLAAGGTPLPAGEQCA
ncbi:MAG: hypothetical protein AVDCRST_MAG26-4252 [uncultured Chloroflexia bacterium]|uniref:ParB/Sulfiredoxin domain-containing protein n=1 Tax=uncultured Chloroflexia bacterium TaxID=1672391 RepID=A0A6J4K199_9CHLR|nr:MAG: hypothetical protein AVDCRST_MAG26-4252 [uncultured Chloroflexia bacterium]